MSEPWDTEKIREAFIYDGGEAEYYDPISGASEQRRIAGGIFDAWLAVYTAEKQAEALELAAAAGAGYVVTAANRRYREGAEHADIYWKRALERAAQRLREQATNQGDRSTT